MSGVLGWLSSCCCSGSAGVTHRRRDRLRPDFRIAPPMRQPGRSWSTCLLPFRRSTQDCAWRRFPKCGERASASGAASTDRSTGTERRLGSTSLCSARRGPASSRGRTRHGRKTGVLRRSVGPRHPLALRIANDLRPAVRKACRWLAPSAVRRGAPAGGRSFARTAGRDRRTAPQAARACNVGAHHR